MKYKFKKPNKNDFFTNYLLSIKLNEFKNIRKNVHKTLNNQLTKNKNRGETLVSFVPATYNKIDLIKF